ncbi:hypothetical protein [Calothrix sp. PCC 7507]|uniref:hypothetical protein n=1 Tax=Calothrix sp. PCC 7507 TaxID=99598 RepID=UPI0002F00A1B|nr:hypothetical protein [Calothrix sp. PCC 7507]
MSLGAGNREWAEGFESCLLFFTQFAFIVPTYLVNLKLIVAEMKTVQGDLADLRSLCGN